MHVVWTVLLDDLFCVKYAYLRPLWSEELSDVSVCFSANSPAEEGETKKADTQPAADWLSTGQCIFLHISSQKLTLTLSRIFLIPWHQLQQVSG